MCPCIAGILRLAIAPSRFCPYCGLLLISLLDLHAALPLQLINSLSMLFINLGAGNQASGPPSTYSACRGKTSGATGTR